MLIEDNFDFIKSYKALGIKTNDKVLLCLSSLKILYLLKNKNFTKNVNFDQLLGGVFQKAINDLIQLIGKNGTILVPTYNWDFCKGKTYNFYRTPSSVGSLGNYVLNRKDFKRTRNPIYSFAVMGKDQHKICKLSPKSCFGLNSPFEYLIKNKAKNLFVGFDDYREGFHFPYVAEEKAVVTSIEGDNAPALKIGDVIVQVDPRYFRPSEVETLLGDPSHAKNKLGWVPEITVQEVCIEMVQEDLKLAKRTRLLKEHGYVVSTAAEN